MSDFRVLDLFCGAGGAAVGIKRAWPDAQITGVDVVAQPRYPFRFVQADAMTFPLDGFDFVWASPPCQHYTALRSLHQKRTYPDLLAATRARLKAWGGIWIIENVMGAPLLNPTVLCGLSFGLRVYRHRGFESNRLLLAPTHRKHVLVAVTRHRQATWAAGGIVSITGDVGVYLGREAMGIDWMTGAELSQAIPPAYSEYLARQVRTALRPLGPHAEARTVRP